MADEAGDRSAEGERVSDQEAEKVFSGLESWYGRRGTDGRASAAHRHRAIVASRV